VVAPIRGNLVPLDLVEKAKKQNNEAILGLIERKCSEINEQVEALGRLHYDTPPADLRPRFDALEFPEPMPI
jgi:predicted RNA-binding protein with PUA domain